MTHLTSEVVLLDVSAHRALFTKRSKKAEEIPLDSLTRVGVVVVLFSPGQPQNPLQGTGSDPMSVKGQACQVPHQ